MFNKVVSCHIGQLLGDHCLHNLWILFVIIMVHFSLFCFLLDSLLVIFDQILVFVGPKIGLYFSWLGYYTAWLTIPGLAVQLIQWVFTWNFFLGGIHEYFWILNSELCAFLVFCRYRSIGRNRCSTRIRRNKTRSLWWRSAPQHPYVLCHGFLECFVCVLLEEKECFIGWVVFLLLLMFGYLNVYLIYEEERGKNYLEMISTNGCGMWNAGYGIWNGLLFFLYKLKSTSLPLYDFALIAIVHKEMLD